MTATYDFPKLDSPAKCAALWPKYPEKVVGLWATGSPRQNVDVLWRLREELLRLKVPVIFFFTESALPMLRTLLNRDSTHRNTDDIYQINNAKYFRLLNFVDVLVSNDYLVKVESSKHIKAKLVGLPHHAKMDNPYLYDFFYDYIISDVNRIGSFDYSIYPDYLKIHRNSHYTQLVAGHPKIDLIIEERKNNTGAFSQPVLLLYPTHINWSIELQKISPAVYENIWSAIITNFLKHYPSGIVILSPMREEASHPAMERIKSRFKNDPRFFFDDEDDNKFWLARATYFITDYSKGFVNFCMTAKRPAIRMEYAQVGAVPRRDEWGWIISEPNQLIPLLEEMDRETTRWAELLMAKQKREMPTLGMNFVLLARMIQRIFNDDDDPAWLRMDKGHTACERTGDLLKLVAHCTKRSSYALNYLNVWLTPILKFAPVPISPKIWLLFLKRAFIADCGRDSPKAINHIYTRVDTPFTISLFTNMWLNNALESLPLTQIISLIRYLMRKYPHKITTILLILGTAHQLTGAHKKRALFFLLMEAPHYNKEVLLMVNDLAKQCRSIFPGLFLTSSIASCPLP